MQELLHERLKSLARTQPDKTAIVWYGAEITYAQLNRLIDGCASMLARRHVKKGDRVALFMQNCPQYIVAHFGVQQLGAVVCPCSPQFKTQELSYQLGDLKPTVLIAGDELLPIVREVMSQVPVGELLLVNYGDLLPATPTYPVPAQVRGERNISTDQDFLELCMPDLPGNATHEVGIDDLAMLIYTSGTTGRAKGAMLSHRNALFKTIGTIQAMGILDSDVHLAIPPLYHISGMLCGFDIPLYAGGTLVLHYRFDVISALTSIERHRVTYWKSITPMLFAALEACISRKFDLTPLRITTATSFGVQTTRELSDRWAELTGGCQVSESGYGLTETHTFDAVMPRDAVRWGCTGRLLSGVRCRIINPETGKDVEIGRSGEIVLHSPGNFMGYWGQPEKTAETLRDGWVYTGDIGTLDEDNYLTWQGRFKELIKVSGYSVFPEDVESLLSEHPMVDRAAVVGVAHPSKGEVVNAIIVANDDALTEESLIAWSRANMAAYKVPHRIVFAKALPMTPSGKVMRGEVRKLVNALS